MMNFIRQHLLTVVVGGVVVVAAVAWLAFGYFGIHTLFVDDTVSEAAPVFDEPARVDAAPEATAPTVPPTTPAGSAPTEPPAPAETTGPSDSSGSEIVDGSATTVPATTAPAATDAEPEIAIEFSGAFVSDAHPTVGDAVVLGNGTGQRFLRFEAFETDNGPDLNVYLVNSSTGDVSDYIDLGDLKGNIGEQNYELPTDVDLSVYDQVAIWCVRFGVGFGHADLMAA